MSEINEGSNGGIFRKQMTLELIIRKIAYLAGKGGRWSMRKWE